MISCVWRLIFINNCVLHVLVGVAIMLTAMLNDARSSSVDASDSDPLMSCRLQCYAFAPPAIVSAELHDRITAMSNIVSIVMQYDVVPRMSLKTSRVSVCTDHAFGMSFAAISCPVLLEFSLYVVVQWCAGFSWKNCFDIAPPAQLLPVLIPLFCVWCFLFCSCRRCWNA